MEILFLILKIVGVLLLACVLLLVAAVAVPVRYRIRAEFYQEASGSAVFSWLLHIIDFRVRYEEKEVSLRLRIFGIPVGFHKDKVEGGVSQRGNADEDASDREMPDKEEPDEEMPDEDASGKEIPDEEEPDEELADEEISDKSVDVSIPRQTNKKDESHKKGGRKGSKRRKKRGIFWRIRRFFRGIKQRILDLMAGADTVKEKIQNIKNMISDETNRNAARKLWRILRYLIRHFSPRKVSGELAFGMADPAQTGQVLGIFSMLPFWARYKINVYPNFEAEQLFVKGRLQMKGHIRLWHLILSVIRLFIDKEIRLAWRRIRT